MKKCKKYKVNKVVAFMLILLTGICLICYWLLSYQINVDAGLANDKKALYETIKSVLLVVISTCGFSLLSGVIVEVNSRNTYLSEIIANDVIGSEEFYNHMDDDIKEKMYEALEANIFANNNITRQMYKSVRDKLKNSTDKYYYTKCAYSVTCIVHEDYIEKQITRTTSIRSYENRVILNNYKIIEYSSKMFNGLKSFEKGALKIDGMAISDNDCKEVHDKKTLNLDEQNEYNCFTIYEYNKKLEISNDKDTTIVMNYITRTSIDDKASTFRVAYPCKEFNLHCSIMQHDKYRLVGSAYGFLDNADNSTNNSTKSNITIEFDDWIFKHDGATVVILDK